VRSVSGVIPSLPPTDVSAAHSDGYSSGTLDDHPHGPRARLW